jgi:hypothetical protein
VRLAARGSRDRNGHEEPVLEHVERMTLRRRARRVHAQAILLALGGLALALVVQLLVVAV